MCDPDFVLDGPVIRAQLHDELKELGVEPGDSLLVHAAMSALGWVCGGATEVVQALVDRVGPTGNIVVPTQTLDNRDPSRWNHYPPGVVPDHWRSTLRDHVPPYDKELTPSIGMGAIAERVRTWPGAVRSDHPQTSFAAIGPLAGKLMAGHTLVSQLGEYSPLARLAEVQAKVLLLGVGYDKCTAFHLAEYRQPSLQMWDNACVVRVDGRRTWITYRTVKLDDSDFAHLGRDFEAGPSDVRVGPIGRAECRLFAMTDAIAFAGAWFAHHRQGGQA